MNPIEYFRSLGWYVTSKYGPRSGQFAGFHNGTDLGGHPCNANIRTPFGGRVRLATGNGTGTWGNLIVIEIAPGLLQLTAHHNAFKVKVGDVVKPGDIIGTNGGTNNTSRPYACHIHYEIRLDDGSRAVGSGPWGDPEKFNPKQFGVATIETAKSTKFETGDLIVNRLAHSRVNVREKPGTGTKVVATIEPGEVVTIAGDDMNGLKLFGYYWWKTELGWVAEAFFDLASWEDLEGDDEDTPEVEPEVPGDGDGPIEGDKPLDGCEALIKLLTKNLPLFEKIVALLKEEKNT